MAERQNIKQIEADDSEELKRYLFFEATDAERSQLESRFFENDELFYELLDLENDLTDSYARNELGENDKRKFETSLKKSPERREKLTNAKSLQTFTKEEANLPSPLEVEKKSDGFRETISNFFGLSVINSQYAVAVLLILMLIGIGFLIYERQRDAKELARLRESEIQRTAELQQQEKELQEQLKTIQKREQDLQSDLAEKSGQTEILTEQLTREQAEKAQVERELENLKRQKNLPVQPLTPTMATVILAPIGGKGSGDSSVISVNQNTTKINATLQIPKDSNAETFSVRLNSAPLAGNLKPNQTKSGNKFIRVNFSAEFLSLEKENLIIVNGSDGSRYNYVLRRQK